MGRGRQKAKHMKVARRLKYYSPETDLDALQRELASSGDSELESEDVVEEEEDEWDDAKWATPARNAWSEYED